MLLHVCVPQREGDERQEERRNDMNSQNGASYMHTDTHTGLEILIQLQPGVLFRLASQTAHLSPHRS